MEEKLKPQTEDKYKSSRICYIIEAAVEYFISILVGTTYLAKLTTSIGISDGVTGILTSFISLGCGFQIFALFLTGRARRKKFITLMTLINQLLFAGLYFVPFVNVSKNVKSAIFVVLLIVAYIIKNLVAAPKTAWMMSLVDDKMRGSFTAKKEIVSLISGTIVSFVMGRVIDTFEENGNIKGAFLISAIVLIFFVASHVTVLLLTKENDEANRYEHEVVIKDQLKFALTDKNTHALVILNVLWNVVNYLTMPFYGTYQINDLHFSMTYVWLLTLIYAVVRSLFSPLFAHIGDKYSFAAMLKIGFAVKILAFACNMFAGKAFYTAYYVFTAIAMAAINGGMLNIIYDYTPHNRRMGVLAVSYTIGGFTGFFTTLAAKPLVDYIQSRGNSFWFFDKIYAQQILSFFAAIVLVFVILYLKLVIGKLYKPSELMVSENDDLM